jgi:voltage-gated potassium channel
MQTLTDAERLGRPNDGWRHEIYKVVFESDTPAGRAFDIALIFTIILSVAVVMLDSVTSIHARFGDVFTVMEWAFTAVFFIEYVARIVCVRNPWRYVTSFFGVIDLLALLPTLLAIMVPALSSLIDVRILRLLRVFRIFKLSLYAAEYSSLGKAIAASRRKIMVFLGFVLMVVAVMGTLMYVIEGPAHGFTSIPIACYWAITTMTTVGFGDITPHTDLGRLISSAMMLLGWGILAVPTGIVTSEMHALRMSPDALSMLAPAPASEPSPAPASEPAPAPPVAPASVADERECSRCSAGKHAPEAGYCWNCGAALPPVDGG